MSAINFHRPARARRRYQGRAEQVLDRRPAPRTRRSGRRTEEAAPARRVAPWSAVRAAAIRSAASSRTAAAPMSATPCCAAFPITVSMTGTIGLGNEFNGRGPFLRSLNEGDSEVTRGHRVPHLAQRRPRQIRAGRRPLRRQAGHADRNHRGRPGAEGRDQSRARRARSSRDRVSPRAFREIFKFIAGREPDANQRSRRKLKRG